jgi:hypothetical protein
MRVRRVAALVVPLTLFGCGGRPVPAAPTEAAVAGRIDGQVVTDGYGCSNNGHTWTLTPR